MAWIKADLELYKPGIRKQMLQDKMMFTFSTWKYVWEMCAGSTERKERRAPCYIENDTPSVSY